MALGMKGLQQEEKLGVGREIGSQDAGSEREEVERILIRTEQVLEDTVT